MIILKLIKTEMINIRSKRLKINVKEDLDRFKNKKKVIIKSHLIWKMQMS